MSTPIAAWYADPEEPSRLRWWDGDAWTGWCRSRSAETSAPGPVAPVAGSAPDEPAWPAPTPDTPMIAPEPVAAVSEAFAPGAAPQEMPAAQDMAIDAPSIGASLLPPLEPPSPPVPPPGMSPPPPPRDPASRIGALRGVLAIAVAIALCGLGFALYSRGTLDGLVGGSGRQPSNDGVTVYAGEGYSVEVPSDWTEGPTTADAGVAFLAPTEDVVQITSPRDQSDAEIDVANPATRTMVFDVIIRVMQAVRPDMRVLTRAPTSVAGAPGEKLTVAGTEPVTGQPFVSTAYLFVNDGRFFVIELLSDAAGADEEVTADFETIVASFRFD